MTGDYVYKNQATHFRVLKNKDEINFRYVIITCDERQKITCISSLEYHKKILEVDFDSKNLINIFECKRPIHYSTKVKLKIVV